MGAAWGLLALYLTGFAFFTYFCLVADPEDSKIAHYVSVYIPQRLNVIATDRIGAKWMNRFHAAMEYFLVVVYLVVVLGSWSIVFFFLYPWIDTSDYLSNGHKILGYFVFAACMLSWRHASTSSPGIITSHSIAKYSNYPYDNVLFVENRICPTVGIIKLARSKYDRFSGVHVARFDHFCGWLHNPIGEENYRWFLLFLLVHVGMCAYGTFCSAWLFYGEVMEHKLYDVTFYNLATGEEFKANHIVVVQYLFQRHTLVAGLCLLMSVMAVVLGMFFGWHLFIASCGMTTNESSKWDEVRKWHKKQTKRYQQAIKEGIVKPNAAGKKDGPTVSDGDVTCTGASGVPQSPKDEVDDIPALADPGEMPKNIYNRSFVENWMEVLYPRSLRPEALERFRKHVAATRSRTTTSISGSGAVVTTTVTTVPPPPPVDPNKPKAN